MYTLLIKVNRVCFRYFSVLSVLRLSFVNQNMSKPSDLFQRKLVINYLRG